MTQYARADVFVDDPVVVGAIGRVLERTQRLREWLIEWYPAGFGRDILMSDLDLIDEDMKYLRDVVKRPARA
jgi:hypothetical protein